MNVWLHNLKRYGRLLALIPMLMAITVTIPKSYLELVATDVFGTREILVGEIIGKKRVDADGWDAESCRFLLKVGATIEDSPIACNRFDRYEIGDTIDQVDAWTVFLEPEDAAGHAVIDFCILLFEMTALVFCLNIPGFVTWAEDQSRQSAPIFKGHSQRKENI